MPAAPNDLSWSLPISKRSRAASSFLTGHSARSSWPASWTTRPSAGPGAIVYEQFGSLHLFDLASGREHEVRVSIQGDFPEVRTHFENVAEHVLNANISPTGARAVFEAHGEIVTVPEHFYMALGDNSPRSKDSRSWGFVPEKDVVGRPLYIYYPLTKRWGLAH